MPFTVSHAVVALPFVRTPLVPAAIAVGAMAPDLPLFSRGLPLPYSVTHDLRWLPLTTVLAFALFLLWRCVLRPATRELSPRWLAARLPAGWDAGPAASLRETVGGGTRGILVLVVSLALGVSTHVLWDAFTHEGRAGARLIPALAEQWGPLPGYRWLQYGSTVAGLMILAAAGLLWLRGRRAAPVARRMPQAVRIVWWASLPVMIALGYVALVGVDAPLAPDALAYRFLAPVAAVWALFTVALCAVIAVRRRPA